MHDLALRAGALLVFLAVLGGGFVLAEQSFGTTVLGSRGGLQLSSPEPAKLAAPGTSVTFPVTVRNGGAETIDVSLATPDTAPLRAHFTPATLRLAPGEAAGAYASFEAPAAEGANALKLPVQALVQGKPAATLPLTLNLASGAGGARDGDTVEVDYVGRYENGTLFDTSVQAVGEGPFPKPEGFRREYQPIRLELGEQAGTIPGFWKGLLGMAEGQSKTLVLRPWEAYGNATQRIEVPRSQELPRLSQPFERVQHYPRSILAQYLNESSKPGDIVHIEDPSGNERVYLLRELDAVNVTVVWQVKEGEPFTIYPIWPGQSHAREVTDTSVVFLTTPSDTNATLTFYNFWPNMTRVERMNDTHIVLDHAPPEGLEFDLPRRGPPVQAGVLEVTATTIFVETPNDHPLAGQTLVFDVRVVRLHRGSG